MQLAIHVTPKAGRGEVVGWRTSAEGLDELDVKVKSVPEKGKATKEACALVASFLGIPKSSVSCVRGGQSRRKMLEIPDSVDLSAHR